jgi:hypothetical protein
LCSLRESNRIVWLGAGPTVFKQEITLRIVPMSGCRTPSVPVGGQQNSAGLVEMVEGNERGLMVRNLGRADLARTELLACCG